jgi:anti-anti-sigma regulatory factor
LLLPAAEARGWVIAVKAKVFGGLPGGVSVLKITGHATWDISGLIRSYERARLAEILAAGRLVFDLTECSFVDSTVVGLLSHLAAAYLKSREQRPLLLYDGDHIRKIVETINGTFLFDLKTRLEGRGAYEAGVLEEIRPTDEPGADSLKENILLAHETLEKMSAGDANDFSSLVDLLRRRRSR